MLFEKQGSVNTAVALSLITLSFIILARSITIAPIYRVFDLLFVFALSSLAVSLLKLAIRIQPIMSIYTEWADSTVLMGLMNGPQQAEAEQIDSQRKLAPKINSELLKPDHYLFLGDPEIATAQRERYLAINPGKQINLRDAKTKLEYMQIRNERLSSDDRTPVYILSDHYDSKFDGDRKLGIYWLVRSQTNLGGITSKFLAGDYSAYSDLAVDNPDSLVLFTGKNIYEIVE